MAGDRQVAYPLQPYALAHAPSLPFHMIRPPSIGTCPEGTEQMHPDRSYALETIASAMVLSGSRSD
jgi:hypothetical protein